MRFEWMLNLVYPGQTFDNALPLKRRRRRAVTADDVARASRSSTGATRRRA
jgi:hypothetical protein